MAASGFEPDGQPGAQSGMAGAAAGPPTSPPSEPPPTPFERAARAGRRRRRRGLLVAVLGSLAVVAGTAALLSGRGSGSTAPGGVADGAGGVAPSAADAELVAVLGGIDAAELLMLGFDEAATAAIASADDEAAAAAGIAAAAASAAADLLEARTDLEVAGPAAPAEAVRVAYLPHLDAWVAYLEALAADPMDLGTEALVLRINATAEEFSVALEAALAGTDDPTVQKAGRLILERGFPAEDDADL